MIRCLEFTIPPEYEGKKLLSFLKNEVKASSRLIIKLKKIPDGITLDGKHIRTVDPLYAGGVLKIILPADKEAGCEPLEIPLKVWYEDNDLLVVEKTAPLPMHPSHNHQGDTLANAVAYHLQKEGKASVFRAVGRLDKGTSGIVVCALNKYAAARLSGKLYKEYHAVAQGIYEGKGIIDAPIYRPDPIITLRTVDERGERAVTEWEALKSGNGRTLLKIHLQTGRTHQIRVHFAHLGTPLTGDSMYGEPSEEICRHALHCSFCRFTHPVTGEKIEITSPVPEEILKLVE